MTTTLRLILALCALVSPSYAQSNGMDMSMDGPMNLAVGNMLPYLHFTPGDTVWFLGWVPGKASTMVGACIALFLLAILERLLAACLAIAERHWEERTSVLVLEKSDNELLSSLPPTSQLSASSSPSSTQKPNHPRIPPFVPEFDITRGIMFATHACLKFLIMLAVMTFQLAFILSMVIGSGVGEMLFGRFLSSTHGH